MSFNYLEVAKVAEIVKKQIPLSLASIELVEFQLPKPIADLNLAFIFESSGQARMALVFSFKTPWTGVFYLPASYFKPSRQVWGSVFGGGPDFRRALLGAKLKNCSVPDGERVLTLDFENGASFAAELFPARPNWVYTDPASAGGKSSAKGWKKADDESAPRFGARALPRPAPGAGAFQVREFDAGAQSEAQSQVQADATSSITQWMERTYFHYLRLKQKAFFQNQLQHALAQVQAKMGRYINARTQMREAQREVAGIEKTKASAELLKQNLHHLKTHKRMDEVEVEGSVIKLDRRYSIADNVTQLFNRVKKLERTKGEVQLRLSVLEDAIRKNSESVAVLKAFAPSDDFKQSYAEWLKLLKALDLEGAEEGEKKAPVSKNQKKWNDSGLRRFESKEKFPVWIGRNHKENEELVIRLARGNDLWFHIKGKPGAHCVIQLPQGKQPSTETLIEAAMLVAFFSGLREGEKVEVDYTYRKYVKRVANKSRGASGEGSPFLVTYSQNKTLIIKVEEEKLWRILKSL